MRSTYQRYGSDLIIEILNQYDVQYVAFNPGASFRGLHDSIVNQTHHNSPQPIMCCHEEISVAIAHGYAKASGKFMAVFVHANIGLQHASMAIFNAWCDRVPILIIGGIGPLDLTKRRPWIDWIHTSHNHDNIIRDYVKWCDQPYNLASVPETLYRACKILNSEPKSPVFIAIDTQIQEGVWDKNIQLSDINKYAPPTLPAIDINSLHTISTLLINAKFPLILVDFTGRNPSSVKALMDLSELMGIGVIDLDGRYNFPNIHPLCLTGVKKEVYENADLILALDVLDLQGALGEAVNNEYYSYLNAEAKVIHITLSDFLISRGSADYQKLYPIDLSLAADSSNALSQLYVMCENQLTPCKLKRYQDRTKFITHLHNSLRAEWRNIAIKENSKKPLTTPSVLFTIGQTINKYDWILTNNGGVETGKWIKKLWDLDRIGCYLGGSGGAGLGYGLGASIGAALAYKGSNKLCIDIQADGDFLFTPSALWTAAHYEIPLLIIVMNNRSYQNSKDHAIKIANDRKRSMNATHIATSFENPFVDYSLMAKSFGLYSTKPVENLSELNTELLNAINYINTEKKPALIDIIIE